MSDNVPSSSVSLGNNDSGSGASTDATNKVNNALEVPEVPQITKWQQPSAYIQITTGGTIAAELYQDPKNPPDYSSFSSGNTRVEDKIEEIHSRDRKSDGILHSTYHPKARRIFTADFGVLDSKDLVKPDESDQSKRPRLDQIVDFIVECINKNPNCNKFLLTCGTDGMMEVAQYINEKLPEQLKVKLGAEKGQQKFNEMRMVITGAMTPIANGKTSDGPKNLKGARDALFQKKPLIDDNGHAIPVAVHFHGETFGPDRLKNYLTWEFVEPKERQESGKQAAQTIGAEYNIDYLFDDAGKPLINQTRYTAKDGKPMLSKDEYYAILEKGEEKYKGSDDQERMAAGKALYNKFVEAYRKEHPTTRNNLMSWVAKVQINSCTNGIQR
jgi:hypothetical protein